MTTNIGTSAASYTGGRPNGAGPSPVGRVSLVWRVFAGNSVVLGVAILVLALSPATIKVPTGLDEAVVLVGGITAILLTNLVLLRRAFAPLTRLTDVMRRVEPLEPGRRIPVYGDDPEVFDLTRAFNEMLDRLEAERRDSALRSLAAQEGERRRVAQERHDEDGQTLTAIVLRLDRPSRRAPAELRGELAETREGARDSLEDVRRIAQRLRPEALEDLGLASALEALGDRLSDQDGVRIRMRLDHQVGALGPDVELVIYRVAQEAVTNALRHAQASEVLVELRRAPSMLILRVADDGIGIDGATPGWGLQGMRERALLVGGRLDVRSLTRGTEVRLQVGMEATE